LLTWQVVGNLAGLVGVLAFTGLLRYLPLHVGYPLTAGLTLVDVEIVAARWVFHEAIAPQQWLGVLLIGAGIVLVSWQGH